ncbi:tRNA dihydrouridine(16) synthase DusC [Neiella marina]|uniref:tRNA-dihydrouridine(16) synthase n=1 Tax=Neiella holothuriorum TaxID=2870530 RepID=A0ABS7EEX3_9GAMM|nr:tRNA dihydrouridine(16) synthase DusC [Neiella holothuriorum]MBW8190237.1 tRNA dihydrouridine(16) synthase DusC [Neiella holothuriorum]
MTNTIENAAHLKRVDQLILAPMEGVMDHLMRELLTGLGGYDLCVTEFIRVVDHGLPERVFYRFAPELHHGGKTTSGTPVRVQLLGQQPDVMAENAVTAVSLGSAGIDLNFGCPAKTVNKSRGGASLLKQPELIFSIVDAVRRAVPSEQHVSAKIRLGWDDTSLLTETIDAVNQAGASSLVVHARTKTQGYRPPAHWHELAAICARANMPVIANGDVVDFDSAQRCLIASQCQHIMVGRGALALPNLAQVIRGQQAPMTWSQVLALLVKYSKYEVTGDKGKYYPNRIKQWLTHLRHRYSQADCLFKKVRTLKRSDEIVALLTR